MKNEKFCFSKGTGLIALIGIVLVGVVLAMQMVGNSSTSTSTRAYQGCPDTAIKRDAGKCNNENIARDYNGNPIQVGGKTCCYVGPVFKVHCLGGSTPDIGGLCPDKWKVSGSWAYTTDNKQYACCNWYGTVQTPTTGKSIKEQDRDLYAQQAVVPTSSAPNTVKCNPYIGSTTNAEDRIVVSDSGYNPVGASYTGKCYGLSGKYDSVAQKCETIEIPCRFDRKEEVKTDEVNCPKGKHVYAVASKNIYIIDDGAYVDGSTYCVQYIGKSSKFYVADQKAHKYLAKYRCMADNASHELACLDLPPGVTLKPNSKVVKVDNSICPTDPTKGIWKSVLDSAYEKLADKQLMYYMRSELSNSKSDACLKLSGSADINLNKRSTGGVANTYTFRCRVEKVLPNASCYTPVRPEIPSGK